MAAALAPMKLHQHEPQHVTHVGTPYILVWCLYFLHSPSLHPQCLGASQTQLPSPVSLAGPTVASAKWTQSPWVMPASGIRQRFPASIAVQRRCRALSVSGHPALPRNIKLTFPVPVGLVNSFIESWQDSLGNGKHTSGIKKSCTELARHLPGGLASVC